MYTGMLRPASFAVSLAIHAILFLNVTDVRVSAQNPHEERIVTKINFKKVLPTPVKKEQQVKPKIEPKPKKKPVQIVKKIKPKPAPKPLPLTEFKPIPILEPAPVVMANKPRPVDMGKVRRQRDEYLSEVLKCIEKCKYYPRSARRRGIQAVLDVQFAIQRDGKVKDIIIDGHHGVLKKAAREALISASPLPAPPMSINCPMNVEYKMEFALK